MRPPSRASLARSLFVRMQLARSEARIASADRRAEHARSKLAQATDALRVRDELLAIASHELRTPLTALQLQLQSLDRDLKKLGFGEAPQQHRAAEKLTRALRDTTRLNDLIERLLDVSRVVSGNLVLVPTTLDLAELARDVCEGLAPEAQRAGSLVVVRGESVVGTWDRLRIEQVVANLVSNGIKYGGGKNVDVDVRYGSVGAEVSVRDGGPGIDGADVERIFGRFERAVSSRGTGGLGLGLYIARHIVEAHGGTIRVESTPPTGSTFYVSLPLAPPQALRPPSPPS